MKKIMALSLILFLLLPLTACFKVDGTYELEYTLNEYGESYTVIAKFIRAESIVVPAEYNGLPVTKIGKKAFSFFPVNPLKSITLPDTITEIGEDAFGLCGIREITIPEGVTVIKDSTFYDSGLESIVLPNSLTKIEEFAFHGCNFKNIVLPENLEYIDDGAFSSCHSLKSIIIPKKVSYIGELAFTSEHLIIYCEAESQPQGWHENWKFDHVIVQWGYNK